MNLFKTIGVCVEVAIIVGVMSFFNIEGFAGNTVLTIVLLLLGASSLAMLVGLFFKSLKES